MKDICCIGHITLDKIITPEHEFYQNGGIGDIRRPEAGSPLRLLLVGGGELSFLDSTHLNKGNNSPPGESEGVQ